MNGIRVVNKWTKQFVEEASSSVINRWASLEGFHFSLCEYTFPDRKVYHEAIYETELQDGQMFVFISLQDENGEWLSESLWSPEEIMEFLGS